MLIKWMLRNGYQPKDMTRIGIPVFLVAIGVSTLGTGMNRAFDAGAESFLGVPLNEVLCIAMLALGAVLMGCSIVFNVVGAFGSRSGRWR